MKFNEDMLNKFLNNEVVVRVPSHDEWKTLMELLEKVEVE